MERRLAWRRDLGANIAARYRVARIGDDIPLPQCTDIDFVEGAESSFGKGRRRTQLAGAERRQRAPCFAQYGSNAFEALPQRHWAGKANALQPVARHGGHARRVLGDAGNVAVVSGLHDAELRHRSILMGSGLHCPLGWDVSTLCAGASTSTRLR